MLDTLPTQRIGTVVYVLTREAGRKFTTAELARMVGLSHGAVWLMLDKLSATHTIPLTRDGDGWWILPPHIEY